MPLTKRYYLTLWDVLILTIILFGQAIYSSTTIFLTSQGAGMPEMTQTTSDQNLYMIGYQGVLLLIALAYLYFRGFDFKQWQWQFSLKATGIGIAMFIGLALAMDGLFLLADSNMRSALAYYPLDPEAGLLNLLAQWKPSLVAYALLNGVYEELYFIGMLTAVEDKHKPLLFIWSLLVRVAFHTYQGLLPALGIGLILGTFYHLWYHKQSRNLYPIILSHALADIWGLGLISYLMTSNF